MKIRRKSAFDRAYRKLTKEQRLSVDTTLRIFAENPHNLRLHNHKLSGVHEGIRSIRAEYDLRILYVELNGHAVVLLITVGKHDEVY